MSYELWTNIMRVVACVAAVAFALTYAITAPWWRSAVSRNVLFLMAAIGFFLVLGVIHMVSPGAFDSQPWIRPVCWTVIAGLLVQRFVILIREQVLRKRDERASGPVTHSED